MAATEVPPSETTRWRAVVRVLRSPLDSLSCTFFPPPALSAARPCRGSLPCQFAISAGRNSPSRPAPVCAAATRFPRRPLRPYRTLSLCRDCRMAPPPFVRAVSYGIYQGRMREAIHALKYDRLHGVSNGLGRMLAEAIAQLAGEAPEEMLVVPVPLHRSKYAQRGFNQSRSLARGALRIPAQEPSPVAAHAGFEHSASASAPPRARPDSHRASAASMSAAHSRSPIPRA